MFKNILHVKSVEIVGIYHNISFYLFQGIVFINGFNLGRYWPLVGPQITLYLPKELLRQGENRITVIELQSAPENGLIYFSDVPNLDNFVYLRK